MKKFIMVLVLLCGACAYSEPIYTNTQGETTYEATCDGGYLSLGDCYKVANKDCPFGFEVKDKVSSEWVGSRHLIYTCKPINNINSGYTVQQYRRF